MRIIKKISKGVVISIIFMGFIITLGYIMIRSLPFQNWAAQKAVTYLEKELKTTVRLKSIEFKLINALILEGLYVEDQKGDTLGYFSKLKINFNYKILFDSKIQLASINRASIEDARLHFLLHPKDEDFNYQFLVDYFDQPSTSKGPHEPFKLFIKELELKNVVFRFRDMNNPKVEGRRFDESFMEYRGINASITPFKLIGDSLSMDINGLSFKERSGFEIREFSANTIISSTVMEFSELVFKTPYSKIGNYLKYTYKDYDELAEFIDKVYWDANLTKSVVSMKDISYFSDDLLKYTFPITISGSTKGTLARLEGKKLDIVVGKLNRFRGDMLLKDMTDPDKLNFDINVVNLLANPSSIKELTRADLPEELLRIGSLKYSGTLGGGLKDFTTKGLIETTIGKIRTDLNLKFPDGQPEQYKGEIETYSFDMGKLLNTSTLGNVTLLASVDGKGFTIDDLNTKLQGNIQSFYYDGYTYTNITVDGVFEKKLFNGKLDIKDPNVNLSLNGMFDINKEMPTGDFNGTFGVINLKTLGYGDINIKQISNMNIAFEGKDMDNMKVDATLTHVVLEKNDTIYNLGNVYLNAFGTYDNRSVTLKSNLGNIDITGRYKISHLSSISNNVLYDLFPDYYVNLKRKTEPVDVRFDIDIPDSKLLSALFLPDFTFQKFTATGIYNSTSQNLDVISRADYFKYDKYTFRNADLASSKQPGQRLSLTTKVSGFYISDSLITDKLNLTADLGGNDINFRLDAADTTHDISIKSGGSINFSKESIDFNLRNSTVYLYNKPWVINNKNHFSYARSNLKIDSFIISNGIQAIAINGLAGETTLDNLNVKITEFNLAEMNPIIKKWDVQLEGLTNGTFTMNGTNKRPVVESRIFIGNFVYNGDSIGDVTLNSFADAGPYMMAIEGKIKNGLVNDLVVKGKIDLTPGNDRIDLVLTLKESNIKPFEIFTEGLFSNIEGIASATIKVKGPLKTPDINGNIEISRASLYMDYLGLPLRVEKLDIVIDDQKIDLGTFAVYDKFGSKAFAGGKIYHKNFNNLRYDIFMRDLKNFNCLDLTEDKADMFFGTAFVDGYITVKGTIDEIYLNIKAKTRPKTVISLPLANRSENTGPDFIEIVDLRANATQPQSKKISGIIMDFDFDVTKDAEIRLIFDAKFNDVIRATGNGNIRMRLNTFGDFRMYGTYTIETGSYNFTALNNLVNKNLKVRQGSRIIWNGPPFDAKVDLVATTVVYADPSVILPASTISSEGGNVAVDCEIYMKDNLFQPQIKLGVDLSKGGQSSFFTNADLSNAINQIKSDQDETNRQFISLLVFNSFAPLNYGSSQANSTNALNAGKNSVGEFMTNQLNNWLSQIDPNWEFGIDFTNTGNTGANDQVIASLKRKLFKERIVIGVTTNGQSNNPNYDINVSYKITKDGRLLIRAFNRKANDPISNNTTVINSSGLGLYYRKEFDYFFPKWAKKRYDWKQKKKIERQKNKKPAKPEDQKKIQTSN